MPTDDPTQMSRLCDITPGAEPATNGTVNDDNPVTLADATDLLLRADAEAVQMRLRRVELVVLGHEDGDPCWLGADDDARVL